MSGVSLVICCHNSADKLPATIQRLCDLKVKRDVAWELIIVDNASTDGTQETAIQHLSEDLKKITRVVFENALGIRNARLRGIAESQYEYICFIDDDNWICPDWVDVVYDIMSKRSEIGACGGSGLPIFEGSPPLWFEQYKHCYAVGPQNEIAGYVESSAGYLWGAGLTIRKSAWADIISYGFPFTLVGRSGSTLSAGEDVEICFALRCCGWRLWYDDRLTYYHVIPAFRLTLEYLKKMHRGFGEACTVLNMYDTFLGSDFDIDNDYRGAWIMDSWHVIISYLRQQIAYMLKFDQLVWIKLVINTNFAFGKLCKILASPTNYDQLKYKICLFVFNAKSSKLRITD